MDRRIFGSVKVLVSQKKTRYVEDEFDLDLTYITPKIIAMGYPSSGIETIYRNPRKEVVEFLNKKHRGHFKVYNLCIEADRDYDGSIFGNRVAKYPWYDHSVPPLGLLTYFCKDVDQFLGSDPANIVVIHCKAGKGRTGLAICSYLLWSKECDTYEKALKFFGDKRTSDGKGVTISSQKRFISYFHQIIVNSYQFRTLSREPSMEFGSDSEKSFESKSSLEENEDEVEEQHVYRWKKKEEWKPRNKKEPDQVINSLWNDKNRTDHTIGSRGKLPKQKPVFVESIEIHNIPKKTNGFVPVIRIQNGSKVWDSRDWLKPMKDADIPYNGLKTMHIPVPSIRIVDETYFSVLLKPPRKSKKTIAALWIHTGFVEDSVSFPKNNLDKKAGKSKKYPKNFNIKIRFKGQSVITNHH